MLLMCLLKIILKKNNNEKINTIINKFLLFKNTTCNYKLQVYKISLINKISFINLNFFSTL